MEQLKKVRKYQRGQATRFINQIEEFENHAENTLKLTSLKTQLELKREELKSLDKEILVEILATAKEGDAQLDSEIETADTYQFKIIEGVQRINLFLNGKTKKERKSEHIVEGETVRAKNAALTARLPKIELPIFEGNVLQWQTFWETFEATIHKRQDLEDIEKLNYLISLLKGEAAKTVDGFALTAGNYKDILQVLTDRYGNTERIIEHHIQQLLTLKPVKDISKLWELRRLLMNLNTHLRTLKNLNVQPSRCKEILKTKIRELFPNEILLVYERQNTENEDDIDKLLIFINKEIQIREALSPHILNPTAKDFTPKYTRPSAMTPSRPPFFPPRAGVRPWNYRQQWIPRAQYPRPTRPTVPATSEKANITCYRCGQRGHYSTSCISQ